ncbi:amidohydrolase family protein [Microbulbifer guangxiensis]|uniref:amidohydrolase family protein n=1 Tax=Microbulbifer guangxiensis TaxID=2904249 RepID=UPI001F238E01|nr:amidohydrolase family protein [Microbulbifer guangxiensis]
MSIFAISLSGWCAAAPTSLINATLYDGTGAPAIENAVVIIDQGKLQCVGTDCRVPEKSEVIDLKGQYITPGLVDAHVHYAANGSFGTRALTSPDPEKYDLDKIQRDLKSNYWRWDRAYLCSGVTAVLDAGGFPWTLDLQSSSITSPDRPHYVSAGPLITHTRSEMSTSVLEKQKALGTSEFLPMHSDKAAVDAVKQLAESGAFAVKVWYIKPEEKFRADLQKRMKLIGDEATAHGLPLIVHATHLEGAKAAMKAGAKVLVHSINHEEVDEEFLRLAKDNEVIYEPTMAGGELWAAGDARLFFGEKPEFDDPNASIDERTRNLMESEFQELHPIARKEQSFEWITGGLIHMGEHASIMERNLRKVHEYGIPVATSTDAGNPFAFHGPTIYTEMERMERAGITPADIIVMSTQNGARAMGQLDRFGTLEKGKNADLVILKEDPGKSTKAFRSITHVMRLGKLHDVAELGGGDRASGS